MGGSGNRTSGTGLEYIVEPFAMPASASVSSDPSVPLLPGGTPASPPGSPPDATSAAGSDPADHSSNSGAGRRPNVYVVHHDGGRAPVTVYTDAGAEVVELPPRYADSGSTSDNRREGASGPRKGRGPRPSP